MIAGREVLEKFLKDHPNFIEGGDVCGCRPGSDSQEPLDCDRCKLVELLERHAHVLGVSNVGNVGNVGDMAALRATIQGQGKSLARMQVELNNARFARDEAKEQVRRMREDASETLRLLGKVVKQKDELECTQEVQRRQIQASAAHAEKLVEQIDRLAEFIMAMVPGEPSLSEGAVDCAIRVMRKWRYAIEDALKEIGVPTDAYPAPIANAAEKLEAALNKVSTE
jgi:hypothetical protein